MTRTLAILVALAAAAAPPNLLDNGGFELWVPVTALHEAIQRSAPVQAVAVVGDELPVNWVPGDTPYEDDVPRTGQVARDPEIRHGGEAAVRLHNDSVLDITYLARRPGDFQDVEHFRLRSRRRYRLTWWVRGENVRPGGDGPGPIMMGYYLAPTGDGARRVNFSQSLPKALLGDGTFEWTRQTFYFTTVEAPEDTEVEAAFSLQLRRAAGTIWYDDVQLVDLGPVVVVETF